MKLPEKRSDRILLFIAIAFFLLLVLLVIIDLSFLAPALVAVIVLILGALGIHFWQKRQKKQRKADFDEKLAAKEGIEDRRREWGEWIATLESRGIDRYELPFYLVVGEPQSGKSVLLQNSDLHFPFGQDRLSGIGGTRGCDWWFTEEAVLLDLAGRLFTHEGGVADKLEWEAFLELLHDYRPMCPANGVLLIIPCDALLEDDPKLCAEKANKIQSALLTLSERLQAKLPVYVVLTKADRIFGFAETVHRLDAEERAQIFGWSRSAEQDGKPFSLEQAREGFFELVDRARSLRERMLSTARLPEALPEVDRFYAFPDELAGLYPALELYLKRVFSESALIDGMSVRGLYITSGLQSGVPIAKVCGDLLGGDRESDSRKLESLFSHQRAYFIRDLIKKRVFAERGLVRPTSARLKSAKKKATVGYGIAGLVAVAALGWGITHVSSNRDEAADRTIDAAVAAGAAAERVDEAERGTTGELLALLQPMRAAAEFEDFSGIETAFGSLREQFLKLYRSTLQHRVIPRAVEECQLVLADYARDGDAPEDAREFDAWLRLSTTLASKSVDLADPRILRSVDKLLDLDGALVAELTSGLAQDVDQKFSVPAGLSAEVAAQHFGLLVGSTDPINPWFLGGGLGFLVARAEMQRLREVIDPRSPTPNWETRVGAIYLADCERFKNACKVFRTMLAEFTGKEILRASVQRQQDELDAWAQTLADRIPPNRVPEGVRLQSRPGNDLSLMVDEIKWEKSEGLQEAVGDAASLLGKQGREALTRGAGDLAKALPVTSGEGAIELRFADDHAPILGVLPPDWNLATLAKDLSRVPTGEGLEGIARSKIQSVTAMLPSRVRTWASALDAVERDLGDPTDLVWAGQTLFVLRRDYVSKFVAARERPIRDGVNHLDELLSGLADQEIAGCQERLLTSMEPGRASRSGPAWSTLELLFSLELTDQAGAGWKRVQQAAGTRRAVVLQQIEDRVLERWEDDSYGSPETIDELGREVVQHFGALRASLGNFADLADWDEDHLRFERQADALLSNELDDVADRLERELAGEEFSRLLGRGLDGLVQELRDRLDKPGQVASRTNPIVGVLGVRSDWQNAIVDENGLDDWAGSRLSKAALSLKRLDRRSSTIGKREFERDPLADQSRRLVAELNRDRSPASQARILLESGLWAGLDPVAGDVPSESAGDRERDRGRAADLYYGQPMRALREVMSTTVRGGYLQAFRDVVAPASSASLFDAFYGSSSETPGLEVPDLDRLLRDGGTLDGLREDWGMRAGSPSRESIDMSASAWWPFEQFVFEWRDALVGNRRGKEFNGLELFIEWSPPDSGRAGTAWDARLGDTENRRFIAVRFPKRGVDASSHQIAIPGEVWPAELGAWSEKLTSWSFRAAADGSLPELWLALNERPGNWSEDDRRSNPRTRLFEDRGFLAPFRTALRPVAEKLDDGWTVTRIEVLDVSNESAVPEALPIAMRFLRRGGNGTDLEPISLPILPEQPRR